MRVKIVEKRFGGVEFGSEVKVLHLGGQSSANVEKLEFSLPESWKGKSVTLHIQRQDGTLPAPILLDEAASCRVGKEFTASSCGSWMLLALGEDGFRALTKPAKYDCYETLATDGDAEISPTQYETFVARVLAYANNAQDAAKEARNSAGQAGKDAQAAAEAKAGAEDAAARAEAAQESAGTNAERAEDAAKKAEKFAPPKDGPVTAVNGEGGNVYLTAEMVGAVAENSAWYVKSMTVAGKTVTLTMGDGSTQTLQTMDTTTLENMTGILGTEHGGTGKDTALTAADVGAYSKEESYEKAEVYSKEEADGKFGTPYTLPPATAVQLGGVKVGAGLSVEEDGTMTLTKAIGLIVFPVGSIYQSTDPASPAALFGGTWEQVASERVLMGVSSTHAAGATAEAGLPNITGTAQYDGSHGFAGSNASGSFYAGSAETWARPNFSQGGGGHALCFDASRSSAVYGRSSTVQPAAYYVYIWRRTE